MTIINSDDGGQGELHADVLDERPDGLKCCQGNLGVGGHTGVKLAEFFIVVIVGKFSAIIVCQKFRRRPTFSM